MKALLFLIVLGSVIALLVWRLRKSQAEEARLRRKALEQRKKKNSEAISQDMEVIWPVIVRPVSGKRPPGDEDAAAEPTMTAIEFEAPEPRTAQSGGSQ